MLRLIAPHFWYQKHLSWQAALLWPFSLLWALGMRLRRALYRLGILKTHHFSVPVWVVGNLTVGGTGKTPVVIALVEHLRKMGWNPGVVSRGYGAKAVYPLMLSAHTPVTESGDEPFLIHQKTGAPVVVDPNRVRAAHYLLAHSGCDFIVSDDGLQHEALGRNVEIVLIEGKKRFGNGFCLPAGPLREPLSRLTSVQYRWCKDGNPLPGELPLFTQYADAFLPIEASSMKPLPISQAQGVFHAMTGIAHPERFFEALENHGITIIRHPFPDHHHFTEQDFLFEDDFPILLTEKDAIKCSFLKRNAYYWPITLTLPPLEGLKGKNE